MDVCWVLLPSQTVSVCVCVWGLHRLVWWLTVDTSNYSSIGKAPVCWIVLYENYQWLIVLTLSRYSCVHVIVVGSWWSVVNDCVRVRINSILCCLLILFKILLYDMMRLFLLWESDACSIHRVASDSSLLFDCTILTHENWHYWAICCINICYKLKAWLCMANGD